MSFTQDAKTEIAQKQPQRPCCLTAACYGIACFGRYFDAKGVVLHTEQEYIASWAGAVYEQAGVRGDVTMRKSSGKGFEFSVKDPYEVDKLLAMFTHTGEETAVRIKPEIFECDACFAAFTAAAFLCAGVVTDPQKGYMLEFISHRHGMLRDFEALLRSRGFAPRLTTRKGVGVLYFKASEQIEDMLTLMGATQASLEIMNLKVYKDFRNKANRITNCETANIDKMVAANRQVLVAVERLKKARVLDTLPEPLQQAAALREEYPDLSLAELVPLSHEPVSKSGLSHRFKRLCQKAGELSERHLN